jgi:hypothetical protein
LGGLAEQDDVMRIVEKWRTMIGDPGEENGTVGNVGTAIVGH